MSRRLKASIVIVTRNRSPELRRAIASALNQDVDAEVVVIDDGSTDRSAEMVAREFPGVRLIRSPVPRGYIFQRNVAAEQAMGDIIISMDDDAQLVSCKTVRQTLADFDHHRVGAIAIPYVDTHLGPVVNTAAPGPDDTYITAQYVGTAHAVRRDLFLRLGGYNSRFFHFSEEYDYCLRLLDAGYVTRLGTADPLHHFCSPTRDARMRYTHHCRNGILRAFCTTPGAFFFPHIVKALTSNTVFGIRDRRLLLTSLGTLNGFVAGLRGLPNRSPVSHRTFLLFHMLARQSYTRLSEIEHRLPRMAFQSSIGDTGCKDSVAQPIT